MKILHAVRQYHPAIGGMENFVATLAAQQKAAGHQVQVLTLNRVFNGQTGLLPPTDKVGGIPVTRIGFTGRQRFFVPHVSLAFLNGFDVIHVHNTDGFFDTLAILSPLLKPRLVASTHGGFFHTPFAQTFKKLYFNTVTRLTAKAYSKLLATSESDHAIFARIAKNLVLTPNAVEPLTAPAAKPGDDFLVLGRIAPHKHVERVVKAFLEAKRKHKLPGHLHVVGPAWGVDETALKATANGSTDVTFHGALPQADIQKLVPSCGYYLSASTFEGFGMAMVEAMGAGLLPCVQPNSSFTQLIGQAKVGTLVNYADTSAVAQTLAALVAAATPAARKQAVVFAARFNWPTLAAAIEETYRK